MGKCSLKIGSNHISQAELKVTAETAQRSSPREIKSEILMRRIISRGEIKSEILMRRIISRGEIKSEILMRRIISRGESTTSASQKVVRQKPDRNCTGYMTENILRTTSMRNSVTKPTK
jgi:hypothetical protein